MPPAVCRGSERGGEERVEARARRAGLGRCGCGRGRRARRPRVKSATSDARGLRGRVGGRARGPRAGRCGGEQKPATERERGGVARGRSCAMRVEAAAGGAAGRAATARSFARLVSDSRSAALFPGSPPSGRAGSPSALARLCARRGGSGARAGRRRGRTIGRRDAAGREVVSAFRVRAGVQKGGPHNRTAARLACVRGARSLPDRPRSPFLARRAFGRPEYCSGGGVRAAGTRGATTRGFFGGWRARNRA